jgi:hypothetical protein
MDGDVHVDFVGAGSTAALIQHIEQNYGEFLDRIEVLDVPRGAMRADLVRVPQGFSYWHPATT